MKRRSRAEEIFNEIVDTIKDTQKDIEGTVNEYTSNANRNLLWMLLKMVKI